MTYHVLGIRLLLFLAPQGTTTDNFSQEACITVKKVVVTTHCTFLAGGCD